MTGTQLALFGESILTHPLIGHHPMTRYEGMLQDLLAHGVPVPEHPAACASVPGCWHAKVWHRPGVRASLRHCMVPGCPCLAYVPQIPLVQRVPAPAPEDVPEVARDTP